ncbi:hypothetical protein [Achromobacter aegrifaciens]|uniref:Arc-like DNA binding domain-containing protein n=1 Tax=Achromobacter aegrifaciens TaxID=1287736 RepID=A0AAD2QDF0_ACHAE|nr:hypothetical protein [Achromobacter aegrifaciens]CUJ01214.1 Uncharacterised protein [Achromobacter aegrifaciens]
MDQDTQGTERKPLTFKAPQRVREWLEQEAKAGYRTLGGQVLLIIEQAMRAKSREARQ